jgi:uncharacterized protein YvpB
VIAVERPEPYRRPAKRPDLTVLQGGARIRRLPNRLAAVVLTVAILSTLGGGGLADAASAFSVQAKAAALHAHWQVMRAEGIPDADLAQLEQEWAVSQRSRFMGVGLAFWWPGSVDVLRRWQTQSDAIWARDLSRYRTAALIADRDLHRALGAEPLVAQKARMDALAVAATPADFAALGMDWALEAKLVPVDRRIAEAAGVIGGLAAQAQALGIKSDPASSLLATASVYANLTAEERMARQRMLDRSLQSAVVDLQKRLAAAATTHQAISTAGQQISIAALYGLDVRGYQSRLDADRTQFAGALTVSQFGAIGADANQVTSAAAAAVNVVLSQTHVLSGVSFYYQDRPLSCEEASTSMALTHQGIYLSQDQILAEVGADTRPMYVDSQGRVRWGNPYETFVGNVNGSESNYTGFGTYYPPLVRVAKAHGAKILAYGVMSAGTIYASVIAGHPVVAFSTWDWQWHPRHDYLSFDGQWIPWIGPVYPSHVYVVVGVSPGGVLINDPIRGQYWISKGSFEAGYSDFNEAIVFA